jgi:predicted DNA-binding protein (UPF0251 family)
MRRDAAALYDWGEWKLAELSHNPYPDTNILHRYRFEGEIQSTPGRDRILCFDPSDRYMRGKQHIIQIEHEWHQLTPRPKECILGKYGITQLVKDDGKTYTAREVAQIMSISVEAFNMNVSRGRKKIMKNIDL